MTARSSAVSATTRQKSPLVRGAALGVVTDHGVPSSARDGKFRVCSIINSINRMEGQGSNLRWMASAKGIECGPPLEAQFVDERQRPLPVAAFDVFCRSRGEGRTELAKKAREAMRCLVQPGHVSVGPVRLDIGKRRFRILDETGDQARERLRSNGLAQFDQRRFIERCTFL